MTVQPRRYPVGIQTFEKLREFGCVYIDKTAYVHEIVSQPGTAFFLSRPRRFGKSLFLSTLASLLRGAARAVCGIGYREVRA